MEKRSLQLRSAKECRTGVGYLLLSATAVRSEMVGQIQLLARLEHGCHGCRLDQGTIWK